MLRIWMIGSLIASLTGCIFYRGADDPEDAPAREHDDDDWDEDEWDDDDDWGDWDDDVVDTSVADTGAPLLVDTDLRPLSLTVDPSEGAPGEAVIVLIEADGRPDLSLTTELRVFGSGGVEVLTTRVDGPDRLLATLAVPAEAPVGPQDLLVMLSDGTAVWIEDAFDVVPRPPVAP